MKNANAFIRLQVIDACLRNRRKHYYINDLLKAVNEVLQDHNSSSVTERTIRDDITKMEREGIAQGKDFEILRLRDGGHEVYYRYENQNFSFFDSYLTQEEAEQLSDTIQLLSKFKGLPQFEWLDETMARLKQQFQLDGTVADMVSFAQNPDLAGMDDFFGPLFDAIVHHQVVDVTYHRFGRPTRVRTIHPYQLRQYNNRWYLVGFEPRQSKRFPFVVLAVDRVESVAVNEAVAFIPKDEDVDFDDHFYDIVGVSLNPESQPEEVLLKAVYPAVWYIETRPLHPSQKVVEVGEDYKIFKLNVIPNEELLHVLLTYGDQTEVLKPSYLRETLRKRAEAIALRNS
jgi:predicted DNA-binding transcriptional regulator YafY